MKPKILAVVSALVASLTAAAYAPHLAGAAVRPASSSRQSAATTQRAGTSSAGTQSARTQSARTQGANRMAGGRLVAVNVFTTSDDGSNPTYVDNQGVRRRRTIATCRNPGSGTSAYSTTGIRVNSSTTVAHFNPAGAPGGAASAIQAAFNTWHAAEPAAPGISVVSDGNVSGPTMNGRLDVAFGSLGGRTLAATYSWRSSNGQMESDVIFNRNMNWWIAPGEGDGCFEGTNRWDVQDVATHEIGHVYGLGHVSSKWNTMAATAALGETNKRSLASGDAAGIRALY